MPGKCTRKMMVRWALFVIIAVEAIWAVAWLVTGKLQVADTILLKAGGSGELPLVLARAVDPFVATIPLLLLIWVYRDKSIFTVSKVDGTPADLHSDSIILSFGMAFGILGSIIIATTGMTGLIIGTIISSAVIMIIPFSFEKVSPKWSYLTEVIAVQVILLINTLLQGALSGLIFAGSAFAIATITHFGLTAIGYAIYRAYDPVIDFMFPTCDTESQPTA